MGPGPNGTTIDWAVSKIRSTSKLYWLGARALTVGYNADGSLLFDEFEIAQNRWVDVVLREGRCTAEHLCEFGSSLTLCGVLVFGG